MWQQKKNDTEQLWRFVESGSLLLQSVSEESGRADDVCMFYRVMKTPGASAACGEITRLAVMLLLVLLSGTDGSVTPAVTLFALLSLFEQNHFFILWIKNQTVFNFLFLCFQSVNVTAWRSKVTQVKTSLCPVNMTGNTTALCQRAGSEEKYRSEAAPISWSPQMDSEC